MKRLKFTSLLFLVLLAATFQTQAQPAKLNNGSIIITLISNDTIWMGADSRTSALTEKGYTVNKEGMCKIHTTNNVVYAMAGHVRYTDNSFNFLNIMRNSIMDESDFELAMQTFKRRTIAEIGTILKKFSRSSINTLVEKNNGAFLSVVAISFINDYKILKEIRFSIAPEGKGWKVNYTENEINDTGALRFLGHASHASRHIRQNQFYFGNGSDIPGKIRDLIRLESDNGTTTVGMPADVISIYNNGYKWVISSGLCTE